MEIVAKKVVGSATWARIGGFSLLLAALKICLHAVASGPFQALLSPSEAGIKGIQGFAKGRPGMLPPFSCVLPHPK
jgi:hypothetical protein